MKRPYNIKPYAEYHIENELPRYGKLTWEVCESDYILMSKISHLKDLWDQGEYDFDALLEEAKLLSDTNNVDRVLRTMRLNNPPKLGLQFIKQLTDFAKRVEYLTQQLVDIGN
tara:strand:+ start:970 stop:1308 length:339 start_codon:yes stop_codon:yes gene_type:complete